MYLICYLCLNLFLSERRFPNWISGGVHKSLRVILWCLWFRRKRSISDSGWNGALSIVTCLGGSGSPGQQCTSVRDGSFIWSPVHGEPSVPALALGRQRQTRKQSHSHSLKSAPVTLCVLSYWIHSIKKLITASVIFGNSGFPKVLRINLSFISKTNN